MFRNCMYIFAAIALVLLTSCSGAKVDQKETNTVQSQQLKLSINNRNVDVWKWEPSGKIKGHILFSHGAASAPLKYEALILPWVEQGYSVYAPLHVDSSDHPETEKYKGFASWTARLQDVRMVADHMNAESYIAAGHSYGALVALTLGGVQPMVPEEITQKPQDERAALVLAFSPPGSIPNFVSKEAYSHLSAPALIQTGTLDVPIGGEADYKTHLDAYHAAPEAGNVYGLVLEGVDHYFGGAFGRPELEGPKQLEQLEIASEISCLLIDAYFEGDTKSLEAVSRQLSLDSSTQFMRK